MIRSTAVLLIPLALFGIGEPTGAAEPLPGGALKGRVQLLGSIVDSACSIRVGNANQAIDFKPTALSGLVRGATSNQQTLNIYISDCIASNSSADGDPSQRFRLTFESEREGKYFSVQGAARGIALQIKDQQGTLISPGMLLEHNTASADTLMLNYSLTLVGSGHALEAGDYHATIKLSIQHF
jgi:type 1 fimbria pilin